MELEGMENKEHLSFKKKLKGELYSQDITPGKARSGSMWQWRPEAPEAFLYLRKPDRTRSKQVGGGGMVEYYKETAGWSLVLSFLSL